MTYGIVVLHSLIENDLLDELHFMIFPVVLGMGKRVFGETSDKKRFRLTEIQDGRRRCRCHDLRAARRLWLIRTLFGATPRPGNCTSATG